MLSSYAVAHWEKTWMRLTNHTVVFTVPDPASSSLNNSLGQRRNSNLKGVIHEVQEHLEGRNGDSSARGPRRGRLRAGQVRQVFPEIAERNCVLRLQGLRGLGGVSSARTDEVLKVIVANPTRSTLTRPASPTTASLSRRAPRSRSSSGASRRARRHHLSWTCRTPPRRHSS